jgi:hypothetical protein
MPHYSVPFGHDWAWEREVVRRIRDGGPAPQMYSSSDPAIPVWEGQLPLRTGEARWAREDTEEQSEVRQKLRDELREALAENAARVKKNREEKRAREAEKREADRIWRESAEARITATRRAAEEWEQEARFRNEQYRILSSKWSCMACGSKAFIKAHKQGEDDGYMLTCHGLLCGKTAWGKHESLMKVLNQ